MAKYTNYKKIYHKSDREGQNYTKRMKNNVHIFLKIISSTLDSIMLYFIPSLTSSAFLLEILRDYIEYNSKGH